MGEIGVLYAIDAVSALISGPLFGNWADKYGRKKFSGLYCVLVIINLTLRLTGVKWIAYLAQILTGMGAGLISTTYESWLNYEAKKEFKNNVVEKDKFLKKIFKTQMFIDATLSILVSGFSAVFYVKYNNNSECSIIMDYSHQ